MRALIIHIDLQDARHQLHEQHHADHAEGVGNGIAGGCQIGQAARSLLRRRQAGRAGERAGEQTHRQLGLYAEYLDRQHADQRAGENDDQSQQNIAGRIALEIAEKLGPRNEADRAHEAGQAKISNDGRDLDPEMSEHQCYQQNARCAEFNALDSDTAHQITQRGDQEKRQ